MVVRGFQLYIEFGAGMQTQRDILIFKYVENAEYYIRFYLTGGHMLEYLKINCVILPISIPIYFVLLI